MASYDSDCQMQGLYNLFKGYVEQSLQRLEQARALKLEQEEAAKKRELARAESAAKKKRFELLQALKEEFK